MMIENNEVNVNGIETFKKQMHLASCTFQQLSQPEQHEALQILLSFAAQLQDQLLHPEEQSKQANGIEYLETNVEQESEQGKSHPTILHNQPVRSCANTKIFNSNLSLNSQNLADKIDYNQENISKSHTNLGRQQSKSDIQTSAAETTNIDEISKDQECILNSESGTAEILPIKSVESRLAPGVQKLSDRFEEYKSLIDNYQKISVIRPSEIVRELNGAKHLQLLSDDLLNNRNVIQLQNFKNVEDNDNLISKAQPLEDGWQNLAREKSCVILNDIEIFKTSTASSVELHFDIEKDNEDNNAVEFQTASTETVIITTENSREIKEIGPSVINQKPKLQLSPNQTPNSNLTKQLIPCAFCPEKFLTKYSLYGHLSRHAKENMTVCMKCGTFCEKGEGYRQHHLKYHVTQFKCEDCSKTFVVHKKYLQHLAAHKRNTCTICSQTFGNQKKLTKHKHTVHGNLVEVVKHYKCKHCQSHFASVALLKSHQLSAHISKVSYNSHFFKKSKVIISNFKHFINESNLIEVSKSAPSGEEKKRYQCTLCQSKFTKKQSLDRHMYHIHSEEPPYKCPHCDFLCKNKTNLKRHIQLHTSVGPRFVCEICGASFRAHATLKEHHMYVHSNLRKFSCTKCNKTFKCSSAIRRHARVHSSIRPYECDCGQSYKRMSHLRRHMLTSHSTAFKSRRVSLLTSSDPEMLDNPSTQETTWETGSKKPEILCSIQNSVQNEVEVIEELQKQVSAARLDSSGNDKNSTVTSTNSNSEQTEITEPIIQHITLTPVTIHPENTSAVINADGNNFTLIPSTAHLADLERLQLIGHTHLDIVTLPDNGIELHSIVLTNSLVSFEEGRILTSLANANIGESASELELLELAGNKSSHVIAISEEGLEKIWTTY